MAIIMGLGLLFHILCGLGRDIGTMERNMETTVHGLGLGSRDTFPTMENEVDKIRENDTETAFPQA